MKKKNESLFDDIPTNSKDRYKNSKILSASEVIQESEKSKQKWYKILKLVIWGICMLLILILSYIQSKPKPTNEVETLSSSNNNKEEPNMQTINIQGMELGYDTNKWVLDESNENTNNISLTATQVLKGDSCGVEITSDIIQGIPISTSLETLQRTKKGYIEKGTNGEWVTEQLDNVLGVYTLTMVYRVFEIDKSNVATGRCTQTTEIYIGAENSQRLYTVKNVVYTEKENLEKYADVYGEDIRSCVKQIQETYKPSEEKENENEK